MYNNILITGANSIYFESLLTLISTVHKDSFDVVDQIIVYNFGLDLSEVSRLETLSKVMVVDVDKNNTVYQSISSVKIQCYFLKWTNQFYNKCATTRYNSILNNKRVI